MVREFVMLPEFDRCWKHMGLTDEDLENLQKELLLNPEKGDLIQGSGGLRKIRIAFNNMGKSGSGRVCYVDFVVYEKIYLITAYPKNEMDNIADTWFGFYEPAIGILAIGELIWFQIRKTLVKP